MFLICTLLLKKLRLSKIKQAIQGDTAGKWQVMLQTRQIVARAHVHDCGNEKDRNMAF
jgi:hypothetical protein